MTDHQAIGLSRVALQYQESPKFLAYLKALLAAPNEIEGVLQKIALQTDIDQAEGVNLDVLGEIVGVSRLVSKAVAVSFFGFDGQAGALTFGEEETPTIGGRFREDAESEFSTSVLADPEYRLLIKAKIVKNHSHGTGEDMLNGLSYLFGSDKISITDSGGMAVGVAIGRQLTQLEKSLIVDLDILPRPAGVRISQRVSYDAADYFGFDGEAQGFGEENSLIDGGKFAEEF